MMKIDAYRNLNKPGVTYSIRQRGRVVDYASTVLLRGVTMKHASGKQLARVRTGKREVCQWVKGELIQAEPPTGDWQRLLCDPRKADGFTLENGTRVDGAAWCLLCDNGAAFVLLEG